MLHGKGYDYIHVIIYLLFQDDPSSFDRLAKAMLHGKGYDYIHVIIYLLF